MDILILPEEHDFCASEAAGRDSLRADSGWGLLDGPRNVSHCMVEDHIDLLGMDAI